MCSEMPKTYGDDIQIEEKQFLIEKNYTRKELRKRTIM